MIRSYFKKDDAWEFPCLGISYNDGITTIVLFIKERSGTIVHSTETEDIGRHNQAWIMGNFEPFHGKVTIN